MKIINRNMKEDNESNNQKKTDETPMVDDIPSIGNEFTVHSDIHVRLPEIRFTEFGEIIYDNVLLGGQRNLDNLMFPAPESYPPVEISSDYSLFPNIDTQGNILDYHSFFEKVNSDVSQFDPLSTQVNIPILQGQNIITNGILEPIASSEYDSPLSSLHYPSTYHYGPDLAAQLESLEIQVSEIYQMLSELKHTVDIEYRLKLPLISKGIDRIDDRTVAIEKIVIHLVLEIIKIDKSTARRILEGIVSGLTAQGIVSSLFQAG